MAKQMITLMTDDLDGGEADTTLSFAFDGFAYEIDLSGENAQKFREQMGPYLSAATRKGRASYTPTSSTGHAAYGRSATPAPGTDKELNRRIREWATSNGFQLAERGRIPVHIQNAFHKGVSGPVAKESLPLPEALRASRTVVEQASHPAKDDTARPAVRRRPARAKAAS